MRKQNKHFGQKVFFSKADIFPFYNDSCVNCQNWHITRLHLGQFSADIYICTWNIIKSSLYTVLRSLMKCFQEMYYRISKKVASRGQPHSWNHSNRFFDEEANLLSFQTPDVSTSKLLLNCSLFTKCHQRLP